MIMQLGFARRPRNAERRPPRQSILSIRRRGSGRRRFEKSRDGCVRYAGLFLEGLLGDQQRKTGWMRAEAAGDPGPWRQQAILGRGDWDADALRDIVRGYVIEHLADDDAVLVIDETGFLKQGKASCGVARQYTGSGGRLRTARSASSLPTFRATAMRSSIARCIFRRNGPTIRLARRQGHGNPNKDSYVGINPLGKLALVRRN
jgi:hypothetical protein